MKNLLLICILLFFVKTSLSQEGNNVFGIQFKPIVPNKFIGEYNRVYDSLPAFHSTSQQKFGTSFGMVVKHYFKDNVALETGINFTKRNFNLHYEINDTSITAIGDTSVSFINYQIPISGVVFVRLSDELFMNTSIGVNLDFYPTKVGTSATLDINNQFVNVAYRLSWIQLGANANFGFEYRTKKKGAFYLGTTYNQPFSNSMLFKMAWKQSGNTTIVSDFVKGSFLTVDFRYYLPVNYK